MVPYLSPFLGDDVRGLQLCQKQYNNLQRRNTIKQQRLQSVSARDDEALRVLHVQSSAVILGISWAFFAGIAADPPQGLCRRPPTPPAHERLQLEFFGGHPLPCHLSPRWQTMTQTTTVRAMLESARSLRQNSSKP